MPFVGSGHSLPDQGDLHGAGQSCSLAIPARTGLVAPPVEPVRGAAGWRRVAEQPDAVGEGLGEDFDGHLALVQKTRSSGRPITAEVTGSPMWVAGIHSRAPSTPGCT